MSRKNRSSTSYYQEYVPSMQREKAQEPWRSKRRARQPLEYPLPRNDKCSRCGRGRSDRTHRETEPLERIIYARVKSLLNAVFKPNNLVIKINYYHYSNSTSEAIKPGNVTELPGGSSPMDRIELPGEPVNCSYSGRRRSTRLPTVLEDVSPLIDTSTKPSSVMVEKVRRKSKR
jgi:hypothetical protein